VTRSCRRGAAHLLPLSTVVAVGLVLTAVAPSAASAATPSVATVVRSTKVALQKQTGAHLTSTATSRSSAQKEQITADLGTSEGQEASTTGAANVAIKVTPAYGYISGNAAGLTSTFGMSAAQAKTVGSKWVSWKAGTSQYTQLASDVHVSALLGVLPTVAGTTMSTVVTRGVRLYLLRWTVAATKTVPKLRYALTVSVRSRLPVQETSSDAAGTKVATTFSRWGQKVTVTVPPPASTLSSSALTG